MELNSEASHPIKDSPFTLSNSYALVTKCATCLVGFTHAGSCDEKVNMEGITAVPVGVGEPVRRACVAKCSVATSRCAQLTLASTLRDIAVYKACVSYNDGIDWVYQPGGEGINVTNVLGRRTRAVSPACVPRVP